MTALRLAFAALVTLSAAAALAATDDAPYDLLFKNGTLDDIDRDTTLVYDRTVTNALAPDAATRDTGRIELTFEDSDVEAALLTFRQDGKHRVLGEFPASVGNPMILYFVETVVRDMAESAGGSPFYIRNRVKESLVAPAEVETGGGVSTVTLRPFEGDPNADRMQGFDDLALTVTMSEDTPGWYSELKAEVPGEDGTPVYASTIALTED